MEPQGDGGKETRFMERKGSPDSALPADVSQVVGQEVQNSLWSWISLHLDLAIDGTLRFMSW